MAILNYGSYYAYREDKDKAEKKEIKETEEVFSPEDSRAQTIQKKFKDIKKEWHKK